MWIELQAKMDPSGNLVFTRCTTADENPIDLPERVSDDQFRAFVHSRTKKTAEEIAREGFVKINVSVADYGQYVVNAVKNNSLPAETDMLLRLIEAQGQQLLKCQEALNSVVQSASFSGFLRSETVKPDVFDSQSSTPEAWITFYEYACGCNNWSSDKDKVNNMRLFLSGIPKKWYDMRFSRHTDDTWSHWKESFLKSFQENPIESWDKAIFFKFRAGSVLDYFYEKSRLLHIAEPNLPDTAIINLIIHGLPKEVQPQVLVRGPTTIEGLMDSMRNLSIRSYPPRPSDNSSQSRPFDRQRQSRGTYTQETQPFNTSSGTRQSYAATTCDANASCEDTPPLN